MIDSRTAGYGALLLRLALGVMFLAHGLAKYFVFTLPGTAKFFVSLGFPGWLGYVVFFAEVIGGALLVLGVYARWVALAFVIELLGVLSVHWHNGWAFTSPHGGWEYPAFLLVVAIAIGLLGDGKFALVPSGGRAAGR